MPNPRLEYLFFLQTDRTINQAEREELLRLIDDPANDDDLRELISRAIEAIERSIPLPDEPSRAILLTILQTALPEQAAEALVVPMYHPKQTRRWTGYAAAISCFSSEVRLGGRCTGHQAHRHKIMYPLMTSRPAATELYSLYQTVRPSRSIAPAMASWPNKAPPRLSKRPTDNSPIPNLWSPAPQCSTIP